MPKHFGSTGGPRQDKMWPYTWADAGNRGGRSWGQDTGPRGSCLESSPEEGASAMRTKKLSRCSLGEGSCEGFRVEPSACAQDRA